MRTSRSVSNPSAAAQVSTAVERILTSAAMESGKQGDEGQRWRSVTAELRSVFTYLTISQLAYDMGQVERGDQSLGRAQEACVAAKSSLPFLSQTVRDDLLTQLELLKPIFEACKSQRSEFHASLRQPSLS